MYVQKVSKLKLYSPKQEWTTSETFIFFKIINNGTQHIYSIEFSIDQSTAEISPLIWSKAAHHIFNDFHVFKSRLWFEFSAL